MANPDTFEIPISVANFGMYMQEHVKEMASAAKLQIYSGAVEDYAEYRELVGYIKGLDELAGALNAAVRAAEKGAK